MTAPRRDTGLRRRGPERRGAPDGAPPPAPPEGAANPAGHSPRRSRGRPEAATLYDGHITAECSLRYNGAPACPACLSRRLRGIPARWRDQ